MGEVIAVDFRRKSYPDPVIDTIDNFVFQFVDQLESNGLADEDIEDVIDAIEDHKLYAIIDPDLQKIVDVWHQQIGAI
jgi:hypothetical protein